MEYKIHLAFTFHVHQDKTSLEVINHLLEVLKKKEKEGFLLPLTWSFSSSDKEGLEALLTRMNQGNDEVIYSSDKVLYSLNEEELETEIENLKESNHTLFAKPILAMPLSMFSYSQIPTYEKLGIKAFAFDCSCLMEYHRKEEEKYYPFMVEYKQVPLPAYLMISIEDLMKEGSLTYLVEKLHQRQEEGSIDHDCLIVLSMDTSSYLLKRHELPSYCHDTPCLEGFEGLLQEVKYLKYIQFTTPIQFLADHEIYHRLLDDKDLLSHLDVYHETPYNRLLSKRVNHHRLVSQYLEIEDSIKERIPLLDKKYYQSYPCVPASMQNEALENSSMLLKDSFIKEENEKEIKKFTVYSSDKSYVTTLKLNIKDNKIEHVDELYFHGHDVAGYTAILLSRYPSHYIKSILLVLKFRDLKKKHVVEVDQKASGILTKKENNLRRLTLDYSIDRFALVHKGIILANVDSYIIYNGKRYDFEKPRKEDLRVAGQGRGYRYRGQIHLPKEKSSGEYEFDVLYSDLMDGVLLIKKVKYPFTIEKDTSTYLDRYIDKKWQEVSPFAFRMKMNKDMKLHLSEQSYSLGMLDDQKKEIYHSFAKEEIKVEDDNVFLGMVSCFTSSMIPIKVEDTEKKLAVSINLQGYYQNDDFNQDISYLRKWNKNDENLSPSYNGCKEYDVSLLFAKDTSMTKEELISLKEGGVASLLADRLVNGIFDDDVLLPVVEEYQGKEENFFKMDFENIRYINHMKKSVKLAKEKKFKW
jgi:hypothetical protein